MASLDNFHTGNATMAPLFPDRKERMEALGQALHHPRDWDVARNVPVPALKPTNQFLVSQHPDPLYTEPMERLGREMLVPTRPYTHWMRGNTAESLLLLPGAVQRLRGYLTRATGRGLALQGNQIRYRPY